MMICDSCCWLDESGYCHRNGSEKGLPWRTKDDKACGEYVSNDEKMRLVGMLKQFQAAQTTTYFSEAIDFAIRYMIKK